MEENNSRIARNIFVDKFSNKFVVVILSVPFLNADQMECIYFNEIRLYIPH